MNFPILPGLKARLPLPPVRKATRVELYKRLSRAMDVLRSGFCGEINLDQLAAEACISKYHFLRLFRMAYGLAPYQYIQHLRLEKARGLLAGSGIPITDIADLLGFDNSQSFSRLFYQRTGLYRSNQNSNFGYPGKPPAIGTLDPNTVQLCQDLFFAQLQFCSSPGFYCSAYCRYVDFSPTFHCLPG